MRCYLVFKSFSGTCPRINVIGSALSLFSLLFLSSVLFLILLFHFCSLLDPNIVIPEARQPVIVLYNFCIFFLPPHNFSFPLIFFYNLHIFFSSFPSSTFFINCRYIAWNTFSSSLTLYIKIKSLIPDLCLHEYLVKIWFPFHFLIQITLTER